MSLCGGVDGLLGSEVATRQEANATLLPGDATKDEDELD
jgi:hypothetical protein